jgi:hypothetical protein
MPSQRVVAADPLAADERLRRRVDVVLFLERLGLGVGGQPVVVDRVAFALEQIARLQPERTEMVFHHHPVKRRPFALRCHRYQAPQRFAQLFGTTRQGKRSSFENGFDTDKPARDTVLLPKPEFAVGDERIGIGA